MTKCIKYHINILQVQGVDQKAKIRVDEMPPSEKEVKAEEKLATPDSKKKEPHDKKRKYKSNIIYQYFDPGNHWCRVCNHLSSNVYEVFQHLTSPKHEEVKYSFLLSRHYCLFQIF